MSSVAQEALSREELDAILATVASDTENALPGVLGRGGDHSMQRGPLSRALADFAVEQSRHLATQYQRPIRFEVLGLESSSAEDFAGSMIATDQPVLVDFQPESHPGALLIGRSFFYGWLGMALGAPHGAACHVPDRAMTAVEIRFLRLFAGELLRRFQASLSALKPVQLEPGESIEPADLRGEVASRLWVASFDVSGLGEVSRLRLALPAPWVERSERGAPSSAADPNTLNAQIREVPIEFHAEIGGADLSLRQIAALQVGDTIPLEAAEGGQVLIRLEDRPKFVAIPGNVGARLAVQLLDEV